MSQKITFPDATPTDAQTASALADVKDAGATARNAGPSVGFAGKAPPKWARPAAIAAAAFGMATLFAGGATLFGPQDGTGEAGMIVPFVLWFNFLAGFAYLAAAHALFQWKSWTLPAALAIAAATTLVALLFVGHALSGGAFSWRTPGALLLRASFWGALAWAVWRRRGSGKARHA